MKLLTLRRAILAVFVATAVLSMPPAFGQVDTGSIQGTITDASGGVIPNVRVTIVNEGTGFRQTMITRSDGTYIFTPLRTGTYSVEVEFQGFQKARRTGIVVNVQQQSIIDVSLTPGEVTQTVEVQAIAPLLQTASGSVGATVDSKEINDLPLSGRNYNFLARLTAGVTHSQPEGRGLAATGWFAANGTRPAQNNFLLDGIDNNSNNVDFLSGAAYVVKPPVDAISEFKLQTNAFSAEFGRAGGAVLNATLKSGTNSFHGSAWEFLRNDALDAADFFQHYPGGGKGAYHQNQFGAAAGGPIYKNKVFFFTDYEGTRIRQAQPYSGLTVPTQAQRDSGFTNFSDLITLQSGTKGPDILGRSFPLGTVFDPASTRSVAGGQVDPVTGLKATSSGVTRDPFPGNIIPASRLDPNAIKLLSLYPSPTASGLNGNYSVNRNNTVDTNAFDVRVDANLSDRDTIFGRYSYADTPSFYPGPFEGDADGGGFNNGTQTVRTQGAALSYTHSFSPTLINEFRIGFNREHVYRVQPNGDNTSNIPLQYGIPGVLQTAGNGGLPYFGIGGLSQLGSSEWLVSERFSNTYQLTENLTKIYGSHTFKGGFEAQVISFPWIAPPYSRGEFDFGGNFTSSPNLDDGSTGRAQFLLLPVNSPGSPYDGLGGANTVHASNFGGVANDKYYMGAYFQDDWKVTRKLTLEPRRALGLLQPGRRKVRRSGELRAGVRHAVHHPGQPQWQSPAVAVVHQSAGKGRHQSRPVGSVGFRSGQCAKAQLRSAYRICLPGAAEACVARRLRHLLWLLREPRRVPEPRLQLPLPVRFRVLCAERLGAREVRRWNYRHTRARAAGHPVRREPGQRAGPESPRNPVRLQDTLHAGLQLHHSIRVSTEQFVRSWLCSDPRPAHRDLHRLQSPHEDPAARHRPDRLHPMAGFRTRPALRRDRRDQQLQLAADQVHAAFQQGPGSSCRLYLREDPY